jgi:hypothetical protein
MNIFSGPVEKVEFKKMDGGSYAAYGIAKNADINWQPQTFEGAINSVQLNKGTGTFSTSLSDTSEATIAFFRDNIHEEMGVKVTGIDGTEYEILNVYVVYAIERPNGRDDESHKLNVNVTKITTNEADFCPNPVGS